MDAQWDDLKTVLAVVRGRSLAAAAVQLRLNYTTVARRIARAERALGQLLFERLADGYHPTEAGLLVAEHAARMQAQEDAMMRGLAGQDSRLAGPMVLTAPQLVIAHLLAPVIADFTEAQPDVALQIRATNEILDLERREADLAIRISRTPGDDLTGLRLAEQQTASFASPDWAARIAEDPGGVIDWILYSGHKGLPAEVQARAPGARVRYRFDDMIAMVGAAQAGLGVVRLPMFLGRATAGVVQVDLLPPTDYADIWAVAHPDVWPSKKLTAFRAVLRPHLPRLRALCGA